MFYGNAQYTETIICLANSRKFNGRCIAGKRAGDGSWLRPVTMRPGHEINDYISHYADGSGVQVLDVVEFTGIKAFPSGHQTENMLVPEGRRWKKQGEARWKDVLDLVDPAADLWVDGYSSKYNHNNRIPEHRLDDQGGSLRLIALDKMVLHVGPKAPEYNDFKTAVRASFCYGGKHYHMDVTDPEYEQACREEGNGEYIVDSPIVCVSLTAPYESYAYKLVASIITKDRFN